MMLNKKTHAQQDLMNYQDNKKTIDMKKYKKEWTDDDFDSMGWHDNKIYSMQYDEEKFELAFDIDYIFEWITDSDKFSYVLSASTIKFYNVWDLNIDVNPHGEIRINEIIRANPITPKNAEYIEKKIEWDWDIDLFYGNISFKSVGFTQYLRGQLVSQDSQTLSMDYRKDLSNYINSLNLDSNSSLVIL